MECMELRPIVTGGGARGTRGSWAVFRESDSTAEVRPGSDGDSPQLSGSRHRGEAERGAEVNYNAVVLNLSNAATALATRSAPTSAGFSVVIRKPDVQRGTWRRGAGPKAREPFLPLYRSAGERRWRGLPNRCSLPKALQPRGGCGRSRGIRRRSWRAPSGCATGVSTSLCHGPQR